MTGFFPLLFKMMEKKTTINKMLLSSVVVAALMKNNCKILVVNSKTVGFNLVLHDMRQKCPQENHFKIFTLINPYIIWHIQTMRITS